MFQCETPYWGQASFRIMLLSAKGIKIQKVYFVSARKNTKGI
jgi:hypothetical protein